MSSESPTKKAKTAEKPTYGFIGTGTINSSIIRGLCKCDDPPMKNIICYDIMTEKCHALAKEYPGLISVASGNQDTVDKSQWVFLGLLPQFAKSVLDTVNFTDKHMVVSMIAIVSTETLSGLVSPATLTRCVPLPPVARHAGTTVVCPPRQEVADVFNKMGETVQVPDKDLMPLWTCTALMGPVYAMQRAAAQWLEANGVAKESASAYVGSMFTTVCADGKGAPPGHFDKLVAEQTPGGLNEQFIRELTEAGTYNQVEKSLGNVLSRLEKSKF